MVGPAEVTPTEPPRMQRKILLPCDDTDATSETVQELISKVFQPGDIVHVMHVIPMPLSELNPGVRGVPTFPMVVEPNEDSKQSAAARLFLKARVLDKLEAANIPYKVAVVHFLTDNSSIGEAICCRADEIHADLVLMKKHQRGKIATFFLGSACDYVTKHCRRQLLLLH